MIKQKKNWLQRDAATANWRWCIVSDATCPGDALSDGELSSLSFAVDQLSTPNCLTTNTSGTLFKTLETRTEPSIFENIRFHYKWFEILILGSWQKACSVCCIFTKSSEQHSSFYGVYERVQFNFRKDEQCTRSFIDFGAWCKCNIRNILLLNNPTWVSENICNER